MSKEEIVLNNKELGIETIFSSDLDTLGKVEGKVVYLNDNYSDLEKINKHEVLHLYEDSCFFKQTKKAIINSYEKSDMFELLKLRNEYFEVYGELYKDEPNINELIDNEIVIDLIVENNWKIVYKDNMIFKDIYDEIVSNEKVGNVSKRYLNITLSKKVEQNYSQLSKWEKLFVLNNYNKGLPSGSNKYDIVKRDINEQLEKLYAFADVQSNFIIDFKDNSELYRDFHGEIEALRARGNIFEANNKEKNRETLLKKKAEKLSVTLHAEYKHIVDFIRSSDYEDAFKCLMLKETLTKVYRQEKIDGNSETIVSKRDIHKSITGHMTLNKTVLDVICNNLDNYNNFANLYYVGLAIYNDKISDKSNVDIMGLNTFNKGKWIKFDGKSSDSDNYIQNAQNLSALVQDTPWCTKQLASTHLEQGDFYVFVDNDNKPHIAIKMNGKELDEVRGLKGGNVQELEEEYREVAVEFLTKNKNIENGDKWLQKEEWNKRLIEWIEKVDENFIKEDEIDQLLYDLYEFKDYKSHYAENSNRKELRNKIKESILIKKMLCKKYECKEEDIYIGNICYKNNINTIFPYKVVLGSLFSRESSGVNMSKLSVVYGDFDITNSSNLNLNNLEKICGDACFYNAFVEHIDGLKYIGGNARFDVCNIKSLKELMIIKGSVIFDNSIIIELPKLKKIYGDADFLEAKILDISNLEVINGKCSFAHCHIDDLSSLRVINGRANFRDASIANLNNLEIINGYADFSHSNIRELPNLKLINGFTNFKFTIIENLSSLETIHGSVDFNSSMIKNVPKLKYVDGCIWTDNFKIESFLSLIAFKEFKTMNSNLKRYIDENFELYDGKYTRKVKKIMKM